MTNNWASKTIPMLVLLASTQMYCTPKGFSVHGTVGEIHRGKDGYTASVQTSDNKKYFAVISRVNLGEGKYSELITGDKAVFEGDTTHLAEGIYIKVRSFRRE